jgi:hypothetical protein
VEIEEKLAVALGAGILLFFFTRTQSHDQPRYQVSANVIGEVDYTIHLGGPVSSRFVNPEHHLNGVTVLPIRFPHRVGHEITCVIHEGWSAMQRSAPQNADWMCDPPENEDI